MKKIFCLMLCVILIGVMTPIAVFAATTVNSVEVINVAEPIDGNGIFPGAGMGGNGYTFYTVDWYNETDKKFMSIGDKFEADKIYRVDVWVEAKSGYEFRCVNDNTPNVSATINGKTAKVSKAYEYKAWAMVVLSYTFAPCPKKEISHVDIVIDPVEENAYVPFEIKSVSDKVTVCPEFHTKYYPYGFSWTNTDLNAKAYNGDRFKGGYTYYVSIALKPLYDSYTFTENFSATINGKTATIKSRYDTSVIVEVSFTCYGKIRGGDINPVIALPKAGNNPDYGTPYKGQAKCIDYASTSGWYDVESGKKMSSTDKFEAGKQYRVEIECIAAYGYVFDRDANDKMEYSPLITGDKVDSYSFGYSSYRGRETIKLVKTYTIPGEGHTHTKSAWRTTGAYHYNVCTTCGEMLDQEDHKGGVSTCAEKGKCTVCGYAYLETTENHTPDTSKWLARIDMYHFHKCKDCGAHCDIQDHNPGPEATDTAPQTCKDCGYILKPAKNHVHDLGKVPGIPATCTEGGNIEYYVCVGCMNCYTDAEGKNKHPETETVMLDPLGHSASEDFKFDEEYHWRTCTRCNVVLDETKMAHELVENICTSCKYVSGTVLPETTPEATAEATAEATPENITDDSDKIQEDEENKSNSNGIIVAVAVVIGVIIIAVIVVIIVKARKQKR